MRCFTPFPFVIALNLTVLTDYSEMGRAFKRQKNKLIYIYILKFWVVSCRVEILFL